MSTKENQARDAAAEEYWNRRFQARVKRAEAEFSNTGDAIRAGQIICDDSNDFRAGFKAGIEWAITHDPAVKDLVRALERYKNIGAYNPETDSFYDFAAREALEAYDKARGEK